MNKSFVYKQICFESPNFLNCPPIKGARIDQGHHNNWANRALEETLEFDDTIEQTLNWIKNLDETLIIVTADHSHTMSLSGYADRGADIRGLGRDNAEDGLPYALLSYASGPSFYQHYRSMFYKIFF